MLKCPKHLHCFSYAYSLYLSLGKHILWSLPKYVDILVVLNCNIQPHLATTEEPIYGQHAYLQIDLSPNVSCNKYFAGYYIPSWKNPEETQRLHTVSW